MESITISFRLFEDLYKYIATKPGGEVYDLMGRMLQAHQEASQVSTPVQDAEIIED